MSARSSATRWRMPREKLETTSLPRSDNPALACARSAASAGCRTPDSAGRWLEQGREDGEKRGLAGAIRAKQAEDGSPMRGERDVGERLAPAEVTGNLLDGERVEIGLCAGIAHAARSLSGLP